ncbi:MAG: hypothetical protein Q4D16_20990 [Eubacteriales bacterium]|nr:hypothetical protein [Eubacteriales bacterium]
MKNRIWNGIKGLGITAFLLVGTVLGNWGQLSEIRAQGVENTGITLTQEAVWTDRENCRAQITIEAEGLKNYLKEQTAAEPAVFLDYEEASYEETLSEEASYKEDGVCQQEEPQNEVMNEAANEVANELEIEAANEGVNEETNEAADKGDAENSDAGEWNGDMEVFQEQDANEGIRQTLEEGTPLYLIGYISEYFEPDIQAMPQGCTWESVPVNSQKGSQTIVTKIMYLIDAAKAGEGTLSLVIPVTLRQEYRISGTAVSYPVCQDAPLSKDCTVASGVFIQQSGTGDQGQAVILAETASPALEVPASKGDFTLDLENMTDSPKAGNDLVFKVTVTNTGSLPLSQIHLAGIFSRKDLSAQWESAQGTESSESGAVIDLLGAGESVTLMIHAMLKEEQDGDIGLTVSVDVGNPLNTQEKITRKQSVNVYVSPLKTDYTVEKTADRTIAVPGDTITYQICIRNTGERTLHSVVSTERLIGAGIQAEFTERTGVTLNSTRTQALIPQISPGEAFALEASVTLPLNFTSRELINQVTVVTKETGNRTIQSQSNVTVQVPEFTATPTPMITGQGFYQSGSGTKSGGLNAYSASSHPKTADASGTGFFAVLLLGSLVASAGVFWHVKAKRKH